MKLKYGLSTTCCSSIMLAILSCCGATASLAQQSSVAVAAVLVKDLHVKRVKVGDTIQVKTTSAVKMIDGRQLKEGTRIIGHITVVNVKADKTTPSQIGVVFDKVQLQKDEEVPIVAVLLGIAPAVPKKGADPLAANSRMNSWGRSDSLGDSSSGDTGRASSYDSAQNVLKSGVGNSNIGEIPAGLQVGRSLVSDIEVTNFSSTDPGTIIESKKSQVYLESGTRLLIQLK